MVLYLYVIVLMLSVVFFLMIRRPPRSTLSSSSAASDVYKRQVPDHAISNIIVISLLKPSYPLDMIREGINQVTATGYPKPVSYTHLRAHET
ncbi:hypothetical protein [Lactobacillus sp. CBA3605] [Lactiplantibacillus mudanjiangensis]|nr:hypothetical protein [Lactobacillus sp. CBA3605] [Lactiplantibacillus mudanjiangensis]